MLGKMRVRHWVSTLGVLMLTLPPSAAAAKPPTPELIAAAETRGSIGRDTGNLYRAYAFSDPERIPPP